MQHHWMATLILLTQLDGSPVWIETNAIQAIRPAAKENKTCHGNAGAIVRLGALALCVQEMPAQIREKIDTANRPR